MAVRFDAAADRLLITSGMIDYNAVYTWMAWIYVTSDTNGWQTLFSIQDGTSVKYDDYVVDTIGAAFVLRSDINAAADQTVAGTTLTTGTWYHVAAVRESVTQVHVYLNGVLDITVTNDVTGRVAVGRMESGGFSAANADRLDGRVYAMKAWTTNLSADQVVQEMQVIRPVEYGSLYGFWPCFPGSGERAADYGGLGHPWTESGTLTDEDPPPPSWGSGIWMPPFTAAAAATVRFRRTLSALGTRIGSRQVHQG